MTAGGAAALYGYTIDGPAGPLEVLYRAADAGGPERGAALVCHPHPMYGGTMHTRVVHHLARGLREAGYATLRLNFRGAGLSAGRHDAGAGEQDDARAALEHLVGRHPAGPALVAGHSFGSWVGLRVGAVEPRVRHLIGVGVPLKLYDFGFLEGVNKDILLIQGDRDPLGSEADVRRLAQRVGGTSVIVVGGDHLLEGQVDALREAIRGHLGGPAP